MGKLEVMLRSGRDHPRLKPPNARRAMCVLSHFTLGPSMDAGVYIVDFTTLSFG